MSNIVVMVEEQSMEVVVKAIVEKLTLRDRTIVIPHQGKTDLEKSFPKKLRAWNTGIDSRFVICRDNDGGDCAVLKENLQKLLPQPSKHQYKIRIVMNELEAWYLGDLAAVERAGFLKPGQAVRLQRSKKFKEPERLGNAKQEFQKLVSKKGQITLATLISPHLDLENNRARSFFHFIDALKWAAG